MIDPINPGPAGSQGPAGVVSAGVSAAGVNDMAMGVTALIADAISQVQTQVQQQIDQIYATVNKAITTAASSILGPLSNVDVNVSLAQSTAQASIAGQLASAQSTPKGSYTADQGGPNKTMGWNLWSARIPTGWSRPIPEQYWTDYEDDLSHCFRGWAAVYEDALALASSLPELPPNACPEPTRVVTPPTGGGGGPACDTGLYQVWQQVVGSDIIGCQLLCSDSPGPSGGVRIGNPVSLDVAQELLQSIACTGAPTGGGGGIQWYAGCQGTNPVVWSSDQATPPGVSGQVGPFGDEASARQAAPSCTTVILPPTGGGGTGTGSCCDTPQQIQWPKCIYIDLCDWQTFEDRMTQAIYRGLCKWIKDPECQCPIHDDFRYQYEDCDGQVTPAVQAWVGKIAGRVVNAPSIDDVVSDAEEYFRSMP